MRRRWMAGVAVLFGILALAGGAATLAQQKPNRRPAPILAVGTDGAAARAAERPIGLPTANVADPLPAPEPGPSFALPSDVPALPSAEPPPTEPTSTPGPMPVADAGPLPPAEPPPAPAELAPAAVAAPALGDDPMGAVDSFLRRNRKEADDSIESLTREAEMLKVRIAKVDAALARWRSVSAALDRDAKAEPRSTPAPGPGPKPTPDAKASVDREAKPARAARVIIIEPGGPSPAPQAPARFEAPAESPATLSLPGDPPPAPTAPGSSPAPPADTTPSELSPIPPPG